MSPELTFIFSILGILLSFPVLHYVVEHYFVPSLDKIATRLKMSSDIAGSTLMAAGSSTPELAIVLFAIFLPGEHYTLGLGTIVGSALFNLLIIVGVVMIISKGKLVWQPLIRDIFFYALSVILLIYFYWDGKIDGMEALFFIIIYIGYIAIMFYWKRLMPYRDMEKSINIIPEQPIKPTSNNILKEQIKHINSFLYKLDRFLLRIFPQLGNLYVSFIVSICIITILSWILTESALNISNFSGIHEVYIGLIIMAVGTSIPDLISSVIVAKQGRPGMAINNAIGSNIFDILIGLGVPLLLMIIFYKETIIVDQTNLKESFFLLFGSVILLTIAFLITKWRTRKIVGFMLIGLYVIYIIYEIVNIIL